MNLLYGLVGYVGMFVFEGLILFTIIYMIRDKSTSLLNLLYGGTEIESPTDRVFNRVFRFIVKYGGIVVALWIIFRTIFSDSIRNADSLIGGLSVLFLFLVCNILIAAFEIYFMFPYMLQGYYKLKYPEEYREWEGKTVEEWYGKKYLKKNTVTGKASQQKNGMGRSIRASLSENLTQGSHYNGLLFYCSKYCTIEQ